MCGVSGGTRHTVAFTAGLRRPLPSPRSGHAVPVPTGGGKEGEAGLRDPGQLCHLVAGVRSGKEAGGGEGGALFCAAGSGDRRGAGRGDPSPCLRFRACGFRGGGQRALLAFASAASRAARHESRSALGETVWGKLPQEPAGAVGGRRGRKGQGGHRTPQNHIQRAPPRCAGKGRSCSFYRRASLAYRRWPRPSGALIGRGRPHGPAVPRLPTRLAPGPGRPVSRPRPLVTFREATFPWG